MAGKYGDMLLRAVCSARAMIARTANCCFGRGVSWCDLLERDECGREALRGRSSEVWEERLDVGGLPRPDGGFVGKVW